VRGVRDLIPFKNRSNGSDRIIKLLATSLVVGLMSSIGSIAPVQAIGIGSGVCSSDAGSTSGVVVASSGGYCYIAFTNTGSNSWTAPSGVNSADFLIIAGGGAGGSGAWGGGGGAGEVVLYTNYSVSSASALNLNVGSGGTPGAAELDPALNRSNPGGNSWIGSSSGVVAQGGGAGASYAYNSESTYSTGQNGGSGGGGTENIASSSPNINNLGGTSTKTTSGTRTGYGNNGGRGGAAASTQSGGGGGGAGGAGTDAGTAVGGNGGNGTNSFSTWLTAISSGMSGVAGWRETATVTGYIAGGGGGGTTTTRGAAGSGGAGRGGSNSGFYNGESAIANTGSGGGGSGYGGFSKVGGSGGSGLIIIRYSDATAPTYSSSLISSDGLSLTLTYSESLSATTAAPANFLVAVNSTETRTITSVSISGASVLLSLGARIESGQSIAVTYTDPTGGNDANAIQDFWGNDASNLNSQSIRNTLNSNNDSALSLNGSSQYASASGAQVIPTSTASTFSVEAWIRQPSSRSSGTLYQILSQGTLSNQFYFKIFNESLIFSRSGFSAENTCTLKIPTEQWIHVALVVGNTSQSCYINGSLAGSFLQNSTTAIGTNFAVGQYASGGGEIFLGQIDEVKIWNLARTEDQIKSDLQTYGGSLTDGLVAYYDFNELVENRVLNRSTGGSSSYDLITANSPTITSTSIVASSSDQAYTVVKFLRTFLVAGGGWTSPSRNTQMKYLVVGGGGAGGGEIGGGGGAGEFVESSTLVTSSTTITIVVGVGGTPRRRIAGNPGQNSSFSSITANGGGGGGTNTSNTPTASQGPNLGSQGGGGFENTSTIGIARASDSITFRNNGGAGSGGGGNQATAGGGGGAGSPGSAGVALTQSGGNGGNGKDSTITGGNVTYAGGGGGGVNGDSGAQSSGSAGTGGSSVGGNGGLRNNQDSASCFKDSSTNGCGGGAGVVNTGSGGGGASNGAFGGSGGSGIVIIRYITIAQIILTQPLSDTTTVGTVDTFTILTSVVPAPLTKSVQWQFTADTTTGTTGWTNVSSGTGGTTDTFTTAALTKSMNKYRYRAIVIFSDTATSSVVETSSVATLTVNDAITFTFDTSTITRKYGDAQTVRPISYAGGTTNTGAVGTATSHTVRGQLGTQASGRIVLDTSTSTAVFRVDTRTVIGTYTETITVTDASGATATYAQRVVINPADTLTVQADTLTAITYGGTLSPTATVTGLVSGDAVSTTTFGHVSCANGGRCAVGDIGPGGGVVFYEITNSSDSQTAIAGYTSGGIYLEAAPVGWGNGISVAAGETTGTSYLDPVVKWCNTATDINNRQIGIGQGGNNTKLGDVGCTSGAMQIAADWVSSNGKNDWYLPSQNELEQMGLQKNLIGLIYGQTNCYGTTCYWSSTEVSGSSARALQVNVGANAMGSNDKSLSASNQVMMRPIRAFSPITNNSETVTAGAPTAAGTYSIRPTAVTLADGVNTNNYVNVIYRSSSVTINRATQSPKISMQPAKAVYDTGTATQTLTASSGLGSGAIFYTIGAGSAASCSISGSSVRISGEGVCNVIAFKQASTNYLYDSATAVAITFTKFVSNQQVQVQLYPTMIPLNGANALETTTVTVSTLTISSVTKTGAGAFTIGGTGFSNIEVLRIGGTNLTGSNYTVGGVNSITLSGVSALTGPLFIRKTDGQEVVYFQFDWS
jgi:hypothetical protein